MFVRSHRSLLAPLTPLIRSAALRFAMLASLTHSVHGLAHSLRSLPRGTVEILEYVFMLKRVQREQTLYLPSLETHPKSLSHRKFMTVRMSYERSFKCEFTGHSSFIGLEMALE